MGHPRCRHYFMCGPPGVLFVCHKNTGLKRSERWVRASKLLKKSLRRISIWLNPVEVSVVDTLKPDAFCDFSEFLPGILSNVSGVHRVEPKPLIRISS